MMVAFLLDNMSMGLEMDKVERMKQMEVTMKVTTRITRGMDTEFIYLQVEIDMKVIGLWVLKLVLANIIGPTEMNTMAIGLMVKGMVKG